MTTNALMVSVVGWAATTPREVVGEGVPFTSFRMATTPRYYDQRQGAWADRSTEWLTVKAFRDVAFNVAASIRKGDPVLVHGRLSTEEWAGEKGPRTTLVLDATALGHDLTRGTARFARRVHAGGQGSPAADGAPPHDGTDDAGPAGDGVPREAGPARDQEPTLVTP